MILDTQQKERLVDEILTRSIANVLPSKEKLKEVLLSEKKLRIYIGADATGPQLHLGHATNFILLEKFRRLGHEVIVLFGDFTAMLGDPTDKLSERSVLTKEQVNENIKTWKDQVAHLLDFDDAENPALFKKNSEWLAEMNLGDVINLAQNFTAQQMLERDMFEKRMEKSLPIYLNEFLYPLLQGYDSVAMDVDVEIGGTDQTFNMLAGRTLQKNYNKKEKFVIATTLLEHPVTKKKLMSKSEGNYIALNDTSNDMFGKTMALSDEVLRQMFIDCTHVPMQEIEKIQQQMENSELNPRDAKILLAKELVTMYHSEEAAQKAEEYFVKTFSKKEIIEEEIDSFVTSEGVEIMDFLVDSGLASSKSDARRKIEMGGVSIDGEKVKDIKQELVADNDGKIVKVGKRGFARIQF